MCGARAAHRRDPPPSAAPEVWNIPPRSLLPRPKFALIKDSESPMKTAFHCLFSMAFVLGLVSSVLANVH